MSRNSRRRREAGFALTDYIVGMMILSTAVGAYASLTNAQFSLLSTLDDKLTSLSAVSTGLEEVIADRSALSKALANEAERGWVEVSRFDLGTTEEGDAVGVVEARWFAGEPGVAEVRARIRLRAAGRDGVTRPFSVTSLVRVEGP